MCGILGGNNSGWDYNKGIECMAHRGPDGIRISPLGDFTFAFARLSIIDLSVNGMQPMFSYDHQVGIVFNGEIYGYQTLRKELEQKGYRFRSTTDTEVILNAYLEWGEKFITKIDGMFGMVIYDKREGVIRLFRDRAGIKPLYYYYDGVNFGFSSELKGIVNMCNTVSLQIDHTAVYDYLNYIYIPAPKTYYKNVYKLLPGHRMIFDIKSKQIIKDSSYWKLNINTNQVSERKQSDIIEELKELIEKSVREQMIADVPVGTFLSGGVDSSIITYEAYRDNPRIECFSVGFTQREYNELQYARKLAQRYQMNCNAKTFDRNLFREYYDRLRDWYDEPFADVSAFPTYMVSKMAREKVTVVLTGDGGDEVFGGYNRHKAIWQKEKEKAPDNLFISYIYSKFHKNELNYYWMDALTFIAREIGDVSRLSDKALRKQFGIPKDYDAFWKFRQYYFEDLPPMTRVQYLDFKTYLPEDVLTKVDRASMAVSLETRVPLLSRKIVEFSFSLSEEDRLPNGVLKGILKKAYEKEIGKEILYRKKMGFSMPYNFFKGEGSLQEQLLGDFWESGVR
ncbi:MAG: asparagine synthase (glutamine-hydrolyzing) [Lachnospiraceae bacterium]|nr:asparagine synthase (glutamine-hydrolyzing) [Lachnospiraceae bacterium]